MPEMAQLMNFVYFFYLLPACCTAFFGVLAVHYGKVDREYVFYPKLALLKGVVIEAFVPFFNFPTAWKYIRKLLS